MCVKCVRNVSEVCLYNYVLKGKYDNVRINTTQLPKLYFNVFLIRHNFASLIATNEIMFECLVYGIMTFWICV